MSSERKVSGMKRRMVLKGMGAAGAVGILGFPAIARGQVTEIKIGSIQPMTGILSVVGKTTRQMMELPEGAQLLDFVGPLGLPSHIGTPGKTVLVGGGLGVAPGVITRAQFSQMSTWLFTSPIPREICGCVAFTW